LCLARSRPHSQCSHTDTNHSGLGYGICTRLIDEFLLSRPQSQTLHLLYTTRDVRKSENTAKRLNAHLQKTLRQHNARLEGVSLLLEGRVKIEGVLVDLTKLLSVKALARDLRKRGRKLDAVVCNAGIAGYEGIDFVKAIIEICKGPIHALTYPEFAIPKQGWLARPQQQEEDLKKEKEPELGQVFLSNVFGHYMLVHWLAPLFTASSRIIWVSSTGAQPDHFSTDDIQGLREYFSYESSKRLTDLLVLTSDLPSTNASVAPFLGVDPQTPQEKRPKMIVTHPGIIGTSIADLMIIMHYCMLLAMYFARLIGSPWHPVSPYKGAISAVYAALSPPSQLPAMEETDGKGKWGSSTDVFGNERVARTEVDGWGFGGRVGEVPRGSVSGTVGRYKGWRELTREGREEFEDQGRRVWREMEELRETWEGRLGGVGVGNV
jgi:3-keto steroid reductase